MTPAIANEIHGRRRAKTPHDAEDLLRTALELGDRQTDELARRSRLSFRYRSALFCALHHAHYGRKSSLPTAHGRRSAADDKLADWKYQSVFEVQFMEKIKPRSVSGTGYAKTKQAILQR